MKLKSTTAKNEAATYVAYMYPEGCPPQQMIDVKLAFYAGMAEMFMQMEEISAENKNLDRAAHLLNDLVEEVRERAVRLNEERRNI